LPNTPTPLGFQFRESETQPFSHTWISYLTDYADTTRAPRDKEVEGKDYYFTTKEDFLALVEAKGFIERE
jgi:hypothetical protein